jgi:cell wall-associated NlpC family hydrolase
MRIVLLTICLLFVANVHANPAGASDDLDRFLADKGLLEQPVPVAQTAPAAPAGNKASELVVAAMGSLGVPYRRGGNTFESGYDCSGFVRAIYEQTAGLMLPRQAAQQAAATQQIERAELQPGDLVFFNTMRREFSHVGIYVGDYKFIHSPKPGAAVRIEDLRVNYWNRRFDGARRVLAQAASSQPVPATATEPNAYLTRY